MIQQQPDPALNGNCSVVIVTDSGKVSHPYPLEQDWRCRAKAGPYLVFILPEPEEPPSGTNVVASISKTTAYYYLDQWLRQRFLFLSQSAERFPTVGYVIRANRWSALRPSSFHTPANAIRIQATDVEDPLTHGSLQIDAGVLDLNCVRDWSCHLSRSVTWCEGLWDEVSVLLEDEARFIQQSVRMTDPDHPFDVLLCLSKLSKVQIKNLAVAHLFSYWEGQKMKYEERGRQLERLGVMKAKTAAGTVANLLMSAGLAEPNSIAAARFFKQMEQEARTYYKRHPDSFQAAQTELINNLEYGSSAFLVPLLPRHFNDCMRPSSIRSGGTDDWHPIVTT